MGGGGGGAYIVNLWNGPFPSDSSQLVNSQILEEIRSEYLSATQSFKMNFYEDITLSEFEVTVCVAGTLQQQNRQQRRLYMFKS